MVKLIPKYMYATRTSFELPSSRIPNYTFADAVEKACLPGGYPLCDCQLVNVSDPRPYTEYSPPKKIQPNTRVCTLKAPSENAHLPFYLYCIPSDRLKEGSQALLAS